MAGFFLTEGQMRARIIGGNAVEDAVSLIGVMVVLQWYDHGSSNLARMVARAFEQDDLGSDYIAAHTKDIADGFVGLVTLAYTSACVSHGYAISKIRGMLGKSTRASKRMV